MSDLPRFRDVSRRDAIDWVRGATRWQRVLFLVVILATMSGIIFGATRPDDLELLRPRYVRDVKLSNEARSIQLKHGLSLFSEALAAKDFQGVLDATERLNQIPPANQHFELHERHIPILILVNRRREYLEILLDQLRRNERINETLLIVVHDGLHQNVLDAVAAVDFCQVRQMFSPFGWDVQEQVGDPLQMSGRHHSIKIAWAYGMKMAFSVAAPNAEHILYHEDDFWVTPDMYLSLLEIRDLLQEKLPAFAATEGFHVGARPRNFSVQPDYNFDLRFDHNFLTGWVAPRLFWQRFESFAKLYCTIENKEWDYSMASLWSFGLTSPLVISSDFPRIVHAGFCGGLHASAAFDNPLCNLEGNRHAFEKWHVDWHNRNWRLHLHNSSVPPPLVRQARNRVMGISEAGSWANNTLIKTCEAIITGRIPGSSSLNVE